MKDNLVEECYKRSVELLLNNSTAYGVLASGYSKQAKDRSYLSIFGRDASICALGMVVSGNKKLIKIAEQSLTTLAKYQAENGQIPNFVKAETGYRDFRYVGCIDATLWWLIAVRYFDMYGREKSKLEKGFKEEIDLAISWSRCQEHQNYFLLQQNEASDWADIMPRSGFVLYTNVLWCIVKSLYKLKNLSDTKTSFNYFFRPNSNIPASWLARNPRAKKLLDSAQGKKPDDLLSSYINLMDRGEDIDVFGNILALLADAIDNKTAAKIISDLLAKKANSPYPARACLDPILESSKRWREYMKMYKQNYPDQYQNGGAWPMVGGFWVMALALNGNRELAAQELNNLAHANAQKNWQFNEWFHGQTGEPMGIAKQSWNAGTYILAYQVLKNKFKF